MSKVAVVTYKVKEDKVGENKDFVEKVFAKLVSESPDHIQYTSVLAEDGQTFIHIAHLTGEGNPLVEMDEFKSFQKDLKDRCEIPPQVHFAQPVGNYKFLSL